MVLPLVDLYVLIFLHAILKLYKRLSTKSAGCVLIDTLFSRNTIYVLVVIEFELAFYNCEFSLISFCVICFYVSCSFEYREDLMSHFKPIFTSCSNVTSVSRVREGSVLANKSNPVTYFM